MGRGRVHDRGELMAYVIKEQLDTAQLTDTLSVRRKFLVEGTSACGRRDRRTDAIGTTTKSTTTPAVTPMYLRSITVSGGAARRAHPLLDRGSRSTADVDRPDCQPSARRDEQGRVLLQRVGSDRPHHPGEGADVARVPRNAQLTDPGLFINIEHSNGEYSVRGLDMSPPPLRRSASRGIPTPRRSKPLFVQQRPADPGRQGEL